MPEGLQVVSPLAPPADVPEVQRGDWFAVPADARVVEHMVSEYWDRPVKPSGWQAARLSRAAYLYREESTGWTTVAKFYAAKTRSAEKYAGRELACIRQVRAAGLADGEVRAIEPLGVWRGVLFLEYADGLTLGDEIMVRRSRPGALVRCLEGAARFLAALHASGTQPAGDVDFSRTIAETREYVDDLTEHGVLESDPIVSEGLLKMVDRWAEEPAAMRDFTPTFNHGDATTSNFIFPWEGGVVAVDWERFEVADPAADLGRLTAEVSHGIKQHGGSVAEAGPFVEGMVDAYCGALPAGWDVDALRKRARFYQAQSTLRIARNGWVSRLDRTALVAQAAVLLSQP